MSGWLFLLQQSACSCSILAALGLFAGLRRASLPRLMGASLGAGLCTLACPHPWLRPMVLALVTWLAPMAAWPHIPRGLRGRMRLTALALVLVMTGSAQLLHTVGLHGPLLVAALLLPMPLLSRLRPADSQTRCITVELLHSGHRLELTALVDSGNLLRDPITRLPVIVVSRQAAERLIDLPAADVISPGMRLISVRTVAGSALMPVFRPDRVRLLLPGGWQEARAVVGLNPDGYSGFQALIPSCMIPSPQGGMPLCP